VTRRGDEIERPKPWVVRAADLADGKRWDLLVTQVPEAADRASVAITSDPRRTDDRQHRLKGSLGDVSVAGRRLEQWQYEVTGAGRIWYGIDDADRTLWITGATVGHPGETGTRRRRKRWDARRGEPCTSIPWRWRSRAARPSRQRRSPVR
jgi:hypothetical protein